MNAILLTDPPAIVALKREFAALSAEDAELMAGALTPAQFDRLQEVRARKLVIATEVFHGPQPTTKGHHETVLAQS